MLLLILVRRRIPHLSCKICIKLAVNESVSRSSKISRNFPIFCSIGSQRILERLLVITRIQSRRRYPSYPGQDSENRSYSIRSSVVLCKRTRRVLLDPTTFVTLIRVERRTIPSSKVSRRTDGRFRYGGRCPHCWYWGTRPLPSSQGRSPHFVFKST